jgi:hypothetical protein
MPSEPLLGPPVLAAGNKRLGGDSGKLYYDNQTRDLTLRNTTICVRLSTKNVRTMSSRIADVC